MPTFWKKDMMWKKKPKAKFQTSPIDLAEDRAWGWFSKYIRLRDCIRTTGRKDIGRCISCRNLITFKGNDAGHWITRGNKITKFDEANVYLQCAKCNSYNEGMKPEMYSAMLLIIGQEAIDHLLRKSQGIVRYIDYDALSDHYREKYNFLKNTPIKQLLGSTTEHSSIG